MSIIITCITIIKIKYLHTSSTLNYKWAYIKVLVIMPFELWISYFIPIVFLELNYFMIPFSQQMETAFQNAEMPGVTYEGVIVNSFRYE